ncbi:MAG: hypothetical protein ACLU6W_01130 [Lachnospiraceae bacterium]
MITYTKLNDPKEYRSHLIETETLLRSADEKFSVSYRDKIRHTFVDSTKIVWDKEVDKIDPIDQVIVEEIARSRYLTAVQIQAWMMLRGIWGDRQELYVRMGRLVKTRIIQEKTITGPQSSNLRFYELDYWGYQLV